MWKPSFLQTSEKTPNYQNLYHYVITLYLTNTALDVNLAIT